MASVVFRSARAKVWRGNQHLAELHRQIQSVFDSEENRSLLQLKMEPYASEQRFRLTPLPWTRYTVIFAQAPQLTPDHGLLIGEVLHQFRGALDHLAWALVHRVGNRNLTSRQAMQVAFPLVRKRETLHGSWNQKLPGVPKRDYFSLFDDHQPYRRTPIGRTMRLLRNLSDIDKHRLIVRAGVLPERVNLTIDHLGAHVVTQPRALIKRGRLLYPGTKLLTVVLAQVVPGVRIKVTMNGQVVTRPIFPRSIAPPSPDVDAVPIDGALSDIALTCLEIVNAFENEAIERGPSEDD